MTQLYALYVIDLFLVTYTSGDIYISLNCSDE